SESSAPPSPTSRKTATLSLSINYQPTKFSDTLVSSSIGLRKRTGPKQFSTQIPKPGGGVQAFKDGEPRMPTINEDDSTGDWHGEGTPKSHRPRWTKFKWILFSANTLLSIYSSIALLFCLLTWFNVWKHAGIVRIGNRSELVVSTLAASVGVITSMVGWAGILLNNRSFLAIYTFLLWVCFIFLAAPGYMTYKRKNFNLEGKINAQWSRDLGIVGRRRIQHHLKCCGYFSPYIEASITETCYSRSILPGCKLRYINFQRAILSRWYHVSFSLLPLHVGVMIASLLCANHVTYRFGKGMMPKAYRLSPQSMAVIMDNYARQLAEQYGSDAVSAFWGKSKSRTNSEFGTMSTMPHSAHSTISASAYDTLGSRSPPGELGEK
ncbi:hypothetical protein BD779DRAFT_1447493, partial [Infundibulicybe gibba]